MMMMRPRACYTFLFAALCRTLLANTEKTIFVAPAPIALPDAGPNLGVLQLDSLSPNQSVLRRSLPVAFASDAHPKGLDSWYLLQGLTHGQRYEVRVCWAAVQPTEFWIDVYNITHVFDTPSLIQSLSLFSHRQQPSFDSKPQTWQQPIDRPGPILFLHLRSAADFFTTNKLLMQQPPLVDVDIILDPYLANIFPKSLLPTAVYIATLAVCGWYISGVIWNFLQPPASGKEHAD